MLNVNSSLVEPYLCFSGEKKESIEQIVKMEKIDKDIDDNKNEKETAGEKIELRIRPDDFYKTKKNKN